MVTYGVSYDGYITDGMVWFVNAVARWEDDRRTSTQPNLALDFQDSNTKVNARLGLGSADGRWMVELWGNNVTDERTKNVTFNTPLRIGSRGTFLEAPRTYGLTLRTQFRHAAGQSSREAAFQAASAGSCGLQSDPAWGGVRRGFRVFRPAMSLIRLCDW